jgi:lysozyme
MTTPAILPPSRPKLTHEEAEQLVRRLKVNDPVALLGIRGYYRDTMGKPGTNDRAIYDDCIALVSPTAFATFNANTDPSVTRRHVAVLLPGAWRYRKGKHKITSPTGYPALIQAAPVTVARDQEGLDTGWFGINIHRGGRTSTSSLGCQTIWPDQWESFRALAYGEMDRHAQKTIPYVLIAEESRRR